MYAPLSLNIGKCRLSVASLKSLLKKDKPETWSNIRVATKYPKITKDFFAKKGVQVEAIKLNGSMELAPSLKMCRRIVDLISTGKTLKENGLIEIEEIMKIQSKLIVNRSAYKTNINEVSKIIYDVKKNGDKSLIKYAAKFDKVKISKQDLSLDLSKIKIQSKVEPEIFNLYSFFYFISIKAFQFLDDQNNYSNS